MKKHFTRQEEFEIMKLVLDKFLWLGAGLMAYGLYKMLIANQSIWYGLAIMLCGGLIFFIFMGMLVREYNYMK